MDERPAIDYARIADELGLKVEQVANVAALLDEGNTVPFITRYRKERTGNLDEEQIRAVQDRVQTRRQLAERAQTILRLIEGQGKLTPELQTAIEQAETLKRLDDLYLPYRPKRRSRAMAARERGLGPLAERIWKGEVAAADLTQAAAGFVDPGNDVADAEAALQGAADILAEQVSEDAEVREQARRVAWQTGRLTVSATKDGEQSGQAFRDYFDYGEAVAKIPPHRCLALNRGEKEGALRVRFEWDESRAKGATQRQLGIANHRCAAFLERCVDDALARLIQPSLDREVRREMTEQAEKHAVTVFAHNLKNLLLQPPLRGQRVLAVDPGFRTGCKVALLDEYGTCRSTDVIYLTGSAEKRVAAKEKLAELLKEHECRLVVIGNGTACRETEELISELIDEQLPEIRYVIVNEAGASIYSTSQIAREEFPHLDATARGTISIGRRLQDPLSELVKIDPQHIGVGMYQHDVSAKLLKESLEQVIESCVNFVGVDVNTASTSLLRHVSGLNQLVARRVVEYRDEHGRFKNRRQLLDVPGIGEATFTQAAGFLKIVGGDDPLDSTWIHPESYPVASRLLQRLSISPSSLLAARADAAEWQQQLREIDAEALARELNVGLPTFRDILDSLLRPGRDPRADAAGPIFKQGVLKLDDLSEGMELRGTVLNVVDFGVFVDVGLKDSGLVHISQMATRYIASPHEVASVGDVVTVWVLGVDHDRRRVSLTMVPPGAAREAPPRRERSAPPAKPAATTNGNKREPAAGNSSTAAPPRKPAAKPQKPARPLTTEKAEGRQPLSGFDELKELWKKRGS